MKLVSALLLGFVSFSAAIHLSQRARDEVDDLLQKQDDRDAKEVADKEFNDANSKVNQIGQNSRLHSNSEDEDYMKSIFD